MTWARLILAFAFVLVPCTAEAACQKTLPKERIGYWHYRLIDGQKCWYGPGLAKMGNLRRERRRSVRADRPARRQVVRIERMKASSDPSDIEVWPRLTPFERRFRGEK